jgi:hypothetical protein
MIDDAADLLARGEYTFDRALATSRLLWRVQTNLRWPLLPVVILPGYDGWLPVIVVSAAATNGGCLPNNI